MDCPEQIDLTALIEEIGRYLAAVDLFRALDSEPTWRPEALRTGVPIEPAPAEHAHLRSAH